MHSRPLPVEIEIIDASKAVQNPFAPTPLHCSGLRATSGDDECEQGSGRDTW